MNKNLKIALLIGIPLIILIILSVFLLSGDNEDAVPANDENTASTSSEDTDNNENEADETEETVAEKVAPALSADCQDAVTVKRYSSSYSICQQDSLQFRIDDLSDSSSEEISRLTNVMQLSCIDEQTGTIFNLDIIMNDEMIISSYLLKEVSNYPSLTALNGQLAEADYVAEVKDLCEGVQAPKNEDVQTEPVASTNLGGLIEALEVSGVTGCEDVALSFPGYNIQSVICDNGTFEPEDDIILSDFENASQVILDAKSDRMEFTECGEGIEEMIIKMSETIYILTSGDPDRLQTLHEKLRATEEYKDAELLEIC